jgi:hypothetical protein
MNIPKPGQARCFKCGEPRRIISHTRDDPVLECGHVSQRLSLDEMVATALNDVDLEVAELASKGVDRQEALNIIISRWRQQRLPTGNSLPFISSSEIDELCNKLC